MSFSAICFPLLNLLKKLSYFFSLDEIFGCIVCVHLCIWTCVPVCASGEARENICCLLHCFLLYSFELGFLTVLVRLGGHLALGSCFVCLLPCQSWGCRHAC